MHAQKDAIEHNVYEAAKKVLDRECLEKYDYFDCTGLPHKNDQFAQCFNCNKHEYLAIEIAREAVNGSN